MLFKKKSGKNDEKILAALDALDTSAVKLRKFAAKYDDHIDRAALRGDDARAKILIRQKIGVLNLAEQLEILKGNIELGAYTSQVVADLGKIPAALEECQGLLSESPNFKRLGSNLEKLFADMKRPVDELSKLNGILDSVLTNDARPSTLESRLDPPQTVEDSDSFKAEYAAMLDRIKSRVAPERVTDTNDNTDDTGNVDFDGIISDENKKP